MKIYYYYIHYDSCKLLNKFGVTLIVTVFRLRSVIKNPKRNTAARPPLVCDSAAPYRSACFTAPLTFVLLLPPPRLRGSACSH